MTDVPDIPDLSAMTLPDLRALDGALRRAIAAARSATTERSEAMGTKRTRSDLIAHLADCHALSRADAGRAVTAALDFIADEVVGGHAVTLQGFGTFEPRYRAARMGRNPQTGETIEIAARTTVGFRPAKRWRG